MVAKSPKRRGAGTALGEPSRKKKASSTASQALQVARSVARDHAEYRERSRGTPNESEHDKNLEEKDDEEANKTDTDKEDH